MEIYQEELKIIDLFRRNLLQELTYRQIMEKLGKRSYSWVYLAVSRLSKGFLKVSKRGNTTFVSFDMNNFSIGYLSMLDKDEAAERKIQLASEIIDETSKRTPFFCLLVTGSYASGKDRLDSDLDLVVLVEDGPVKKDIRPYMAEATRLSGKNVDCHLFTRKEFYQMLVSDAENFGKEVFRNHIIFYGSETYYMIIKEAIKNGLQNKI